MINKSMSSEQCVFWVDNPSILFQKSTILPEKEQNYEDRMNTITRLILVIYILMLLNNYEHSNLFLFVSIGVILLNYYTVKPVLENRTSVIEQTDREYFTNNPPVKPKGGKTNINDIMNEKEVEKEDKNKIERLKNTHSTNNKMEAINSTHDNNYFKEVIEKKNPRVPEYPYTPKVNEGLPGTLCSHPLTRNRNSRLASLRTRVVDFDMEKHYEKELAKMNRNPQTMDKLYKTSSNPKSTHDYYKQKELYNKNYHSSLDELDNMNRTDRGGVATQLPDNIRSNRHEMVKRATAGKNIISDLSTTSDSLIVNDPRGFVDNCLEVYRF